MTNLVWLFQAHRDMAAGYAEVKAALEIMSDKYLRALEDTKNLTDAIAKLQQYIATQINTSTVDIFEKYQQQILQEEPFADNKIPDSAWLTPGETVRENA